MMERERPVSPVGLTALTRFLSERSRAMKKCLCAFVCLEHHGLHRRFADLLEVRLVTKRNTLKVLEEERVIPRLASEATEESERLLPRSLYRGEGSDDRKRAFEKRLCGIRILEKRERLLLAGIHRELGEAVTVLPRFSRRKLLRKQSASKLTLRLNVSAGTCERRQAKPRPDLMLTFHGERLFGRVRRDGEIAEILFRDLRDEEIELRNPRCVFGPSEPVDAAMEEVDELARASRIARKPSRSIEPRLIPNLNGKRLHTSLKRFIRPVERNLERMR